MSPETEDEVVEEGELVEPIGHVRVVYLGPVAPHWEVQSDYGPPEVIDQFRERVLARLVLLPPTTPSSAATASASCATPSGSSSPWSGCSTTARVPRPEAPSAEVTGPGGDGRRLPGDRNLHPTLHPARHCADTPVVKALRLERSVSSGRPVARQQGEATMGETNTSDDAAVVSRDPRADR